MNQITNAITLNAKIILSIKVGSMMHCFEINNIFEIISIFEINNKYIALIL